MDQSEECPLTLCYLTVPRDPQTIVTMPEVVCQEAQRVAERAVQSVSPLAPAAGDAQVRARTMRGKAMSERRLTASRSGS
jgi:hypothetical protein